MLGCGLDLGSAQAKPHRAFAGTDPLHGAGRNDVVNLVEVMEEVDDEVALTGCIARPRDLAGPSVICLDSEALDAFVGADHPVWERPKTPGFFLALTHRRPSEAAEDPRPSLGRA